MGAGGRKCVTVRKRVREESARKRTSVLHSIHLLPLSSIHLLPLSSTSTCTPSAVPHSTGTTTELIRLRRQIYFFSEQFQQDPRDAVQRGQSMGHRRVARGRRVCFQRDHCKNAPRVPDAEVPCVQVMHLENGAQRVGSLRAAHCRWCAG